MIVIAGQLARDRASLAFMSRLISEKKRRMKKVDR